MSNPVVDEHMTALPHSIRPNQTLKAAKEMMLEHGVRHLPVQHGGELVGVISERDIYFATSVDQKPAEEILVESTYPDKPYAVEQGTPLKEVLEKMASEAFGCALVLDQGNLVGIFTTTDACRVLASKL